MAYANLVAFNIGLPQVSNPETVYAVAKAYTGKPFTSLKVSVNECQSDDSRKDELNKLKEQLAALAAIVEADRITPAAFDAEDDSNFHIAYIQASANLEASNYKLDKADLLKTKLIGGKIKPGLALTASAIVGASVTEILKLMQGFDKSEQFTEAYLGLEAG